MSNQSKFKSLKKGNNEAFKFIFTPGKSFVWFLFHFEIFARVQEFDLNKPRMQSLFNVQQSQRSMNITGLCNVSFMTTCVHFWKNKTFNKTAVLETIALKINETFRLLIVPNWHTTRCLTKYLLFNTLCKQKLYFAIMPLAIEACWTGEARSWKDCARHTRVGWFIFTTTQKVFLGLVRTKQRRCKIP